jgi:YD repeat-containing protein
MKANKQLLSLIIAIALFCNPVMVSAASIQYTYDNLNRLTKVEYEDGTVVEYSYDAAGNRLTKAVVPNNPPNTPTGPAIANGAGNIDVNADLGWTGGDPNAGDTVSYDIYLDTNNPPTTVVVSGLTSPSFDPGVLNCGTTYYWRVVAIDQHGAQTSSPVWSFTTATCPVAEFTGWPLTGVAPLLVTFTNSSTGASSYLWSFGDGGNSTEQNPVHTYTTGGTYSVSLTVTGQGGSNQNSVADYITVTTPANSLYLSHIGSDKKLYYGKWNQEGTLFDTALLPGGGSSSHAPAMAVFQNRQYMAVKAAANNNIYIKSRDNAGVFSAWTQMTGATSTSPALATFNDQLYLFVKGAANRKIFYKSMDTGGTWNGWTEVIGADSPFKPALVMFNGQLYLFQANALNRIRYASMNTSGIWSAWSTLPTGSTNAGPAVVSYNGSVWLIVKGLAGSKIFYTTTATPETPSSWAAWQWLNGSSASSPSATVVPETNRLHIAVRGAVATTIWHRYYDPGTALWSAWESLTALDPDAASTDTPVLNSFY